MKVKVAQLCLTLCNPMDCSPPGSSIHGTLQARTLEWVAIPSSKGSSQPSDRTQVSCLASDSLLFEPPEKVNISLLHNSTISFLGIYSREIKCMFTETYTRLWEIYYGQNLKTNKISFNHWMDRKKLIHSYIIMLLNSIEEHTTSLYSNTDKS